MTSNEDYIRKNKVVIVDDDKNTKLHYAAALGNLEEIDKVLKSGQKLDPENYLGWTPLMMAVRNANSTTTEILLRSGADATKKNKYGMNVFLISVTCGDPDVVAKILNHLLCGGVSRQSLQKTFSPISLAILFGHSNIFRYLLERMFDANMATPLTGITPMMFAAAMANNKAIKKLLQHGADINAKNHLGKTVQDIVQSRHQRIDIDNVSHKQKPPHIPLIIVSPHNQDSPHLQLTPYPTVVNGLQPNQMRKSSNTHTPHMLCTPGITPITPQLMPHMFFGPDFSPSQFISPAAMSYYSNTFLNTTVTPSGFISSPQLMCHPHYV